MKIEYANNPKKFDDINIGTVFKYLTDICIKIERIDVDNNRYVNTLSLIDGITFRLDENELVTAIDCKLVIES